jgi:hypothetical protein
MSAECSIAACDSPQHECSMSAATPRSMSAVLRLRRGEAEARRRLSPALTTHALHSEAEARRRLSPALTTHALHSEAEARACTDSSLHTQRVPCVLYTLPPHTPRSIH